VIETKNSDLLNSSILSHLKKTGHYKAQGKEMVVRIVRRETGFLAAVAVLGRVVSVFGVIKKLLGL
jgi:hypothetical protein